MKRDLTEGYLRTLKVTTGDRLEVVDAGSPPGVSLMLRATAGRLAWSIRFREPAGQARGARRQIRQKLGYYPGIGLKEAREAAWEVSRELAKGTWTPTTEPMPEPVPEAEPTFREVCEEFLAVWPKSRGLKPRTVSEYARQIRADLVPEFGDLRPSEISRRAIVKFLDRVAHVEGRRVMANRLLATLSCVFSYLVTREVVEVNPCTRIPKPAPESPREKVLTDAEIRELWRIWSERKSSAGRLFQLMLLTGLRSGEVKTAKWEYVDLEEGLLTIPAEQTKNGRCHVIPLVDRAVAILQELGPRSSGWVFPAREDSRTREGVPGEGHLQYLQKNVQRVTRELREIEGFGSFAWCPHDCRRTLATKLSELGIDDMLIGRILNHSWVFKSMTTKTYNRDRKLPEMRVALERWSARLEQILTGSPAKVVSLSR